MLRLLVLIRLAWYLPLDAVARRSACWKAIERDCLRAFWQDPEQPATRAQTLEALALPGVRSITYERLETGGPAWQRVVASVLRRVYPGSQSVEIHCPDLGAGLLMPHPYAMVLQADRIGRDCIILHGVTLGRTQGQDGYPTVGDRVEIGAGACILGPRTIGDGATIGANAVVLCDVPADASAVGVPAKVMPRRGPSAQSGLPAQRTAAGE